MKRPFYWKRMKCWYVKDELRHNIRLDPDEDTAREMWAQMFGVENPHLITATIEDIGENFLAYCESRVHRGELARATYNQYGKYLAKFCDHVGWRTKARHIRKYDVTSFLKEWPAWGPSSQRYAISAIKRCFQWATDEDLLPANKLAGLRRPSPRRREHLIDNDHHAAMMTAKDASNHRRRTACFRPVLIALKHSGGRSGTVTRVTTKDVDADIATWTDHQHKTRHKTGAPQIVYLSPCLQTLTRILMAKRTSGEHLFLNSMGEPWTVNAISWRFQRIRKRLALPKETIAHAYRHTFATHAIVNGVDIATVAQLLGHTDTKMIQQTYGHLGKKPAHMVNAARLASRNVNAV